MPCLNLTRLLPTRKAWKVLTTKIQSKLRKHSRSKAINKPKSQFHTTSKAALWPSLAPQSCSSFFKHSSKNKKPKIQPARKHHYHSSYYFEKRPKPVYIDQLFIESVAVVKEQVKSPATATNNKDLIRHTESAKVNMLVDQQAKPAGTSREAIGTAENMVAADDIWESLVLASPQMHGINERAEEFIARFRAEMRLQERLSRNL